MILRIVFLMLLLSIGSFAQDDDKLVTTIDLADAKPCGLTAKAKQQTVSGIVAKRSFKDDELTMDGVTIHADKDARIFVNLDVEFLASNGSTLREALYEALETGNEVKLKADICGRTLTLRRLVSSKTSEM